MITLLTPQNNSQLSLQTEQQRDFIFWDVHRTLSKDPWDIPVMKQKQSEKDDFSVPAPVEFSWEGDASSYTLLISECEDLSSPIKIEVSENKASVYNLCIGRTYYWAVSSQNDVSQTFSFSTAWDIPRFIKIDGMTNIRDLGGYKIPGGRIKQGLLYRSAEVEFTTPDGIKTIHDLGIKTEIELRFEEYESDRGSVLEQHGVTLKKLPIHAYGGCFSEPAKPFVKQIFELLADESNYPVLFHCAAGADRTGSIAFLIEAVLGVYYKQMRTDYELTCLSTTGNRTRNENDAAWGLQYLEELCVGDNWQELVYDFLTRIVGISPETIESMRRILTAK